ncbi:NAD(P)H-hydrate dehydratase [Nocardioides sp. LHG3406-4]|uniref:NAD(P)H-hydrate dehydratase n=1 Tax=Nocardioides sp. LHG3406-4 TaxID=2804575 RepID=UPI003CFAEB52
MSAGGPTTVTPATLRDWQLPAPGSGKGARGEVLVLGGSSGTPGAVLLAGESALRAGAGKLVLATVEDVAAALAVAVPESMVLGLPRTEEGEVSPGSARLLQPRLETADVLVAGPGVTDPQAAVDLMAAVLPDVTGSLVLDALGSAYLTEHPEGLHHLEGRAVLTVNPTELARTAHCDEAEVEEDPWGPATRVARRSRVVVLCGGSTKYVVTPDGDAWTVQGGGPGLGVSGSGDTQAGIVGGLTARGAEPAQAAVWGAYLHARAGERLGAAVGVVGYLAREIPEQVPRVLVELQA